jgi:hypothetical protein
MWVLSAKPASISEQDFMSDEPFHTPGKKPTPIKHDRRETVERLWEICNDDLRWSLDLRFQGESYAWESLIPREGELVIS